jgi:uncharacterized membrane protein
MTGHQIFHSVLFIIIGVVTLCDVKGAKKSKRYINLFIGILALLIAAYDILTSGFGITIF